MAKVFRYLKRVIVTPAVYQSLGSLKTAFRYWHWAEVTNYTQRSRLAVGYVFIKQSDRPNILAQQSQHTLQPLGPLQPKSEGYFAEFPRVD